MPTANPRVQVTLDPELAEALAGVDPRPSSKSRLIRDMALRGAWAAEDERRRSGAAQEYLLRVAAGEVDLVYDCIHPPSVGGAERWLRVLAEHLAGDHEVT